MKPLIKYFLVALLSISSGIAFAYPLYYVGYVEPLHRIPEGTKPDLKLDVVYANYTLQPANSSFPIPSWYNTSISGQPDFLTFNLVVNVTNNSNRTAIINQLSICTSNSSTGYLSVFQNCNTSKTTEGLWLDGKWLNVSWVPPSYGVPGHWKEGVTIKQSFVNGTLTSVAMDVNGSWVDVTSRVRLLEKDAIPPMSGATMMVNVIAGAELRFYNPRQRQPNDETPLRSVIKVNLDNGFNNRLNAAESRLLMFNGVLPISQESTPIIVSSLNSSITLACIQADTEFLDSTFNGVHTNTRYIQTVYDTINLTTVENSRIYNNALASNQMFKFDSFGVEAFIEPRS